MHVAEDLLVASQPVRNKNKSLESSMSNKNLPPQAKYVCINIINKCEISLSIFIYLLTSERQREEERKNYSFVIPLTCAFIG